MTLSRRERAHKKANKWVFIVNFSLAIIVLLWLNLRESYSPYELWQKQEELTDYQNSKASYLEQRPDSTNFDRTLTKTEADKLRLLVVGFNGILSHQFDRYSEGRTYKDYNRHILANIDYHIDELKAETQTMENWLDSTWFTPSMEANIGPFIAAPYFLTMLFFYFWEVRDAYLEGYRGKSKPTTDT